jgi:quinol monooxygenase YgiN
MIFIVVKQKVRPEFADDWIDLVADFTSATRAEPGNISFEWYRGTDDPNVYTLVEMFRDAQAGEEHVASDHFKAVGNGMRKWLAAVPEIVHVDAAQYTGWGKVGEPAS